jgi:LysM repeat protein
MYDIYEVKAGDGLESIARKYNTNVRVLYNLNPDLDNLKPGDYIVVPLNVREPYTSYTVLKGDTINSIARNYGVTPNTLLKINGLEEDDYIYPNQELIVPSQNYSIYVTRENDVLSDLPNKLGSSLNDILTLNPKIILEEEQLIVTRKSSRM